MRAGEKAASALVLAAALGLVAATGARAAVTGAPRAPEPPVRHSVRESPGWYPAVDPESMSVVVGRRLNAPPVGRRFEGGARSLDELGRIVCRALHHEALDSLRALCLREDEFREILWPEFPESRPATGLTWEDGWAASSARLNGGCASAMQDHGGQTVEFVRWIGPDSTARYRNFRLHSGLVLVVRDDTGQLQRWTWLRAVAERRGRFKLQSLRD